MANRESPNSGYLLLAEQLIPALPHEHQAKANELLEDYDSEGLQKLFENHLPATLPRPEDTFMLGDEDYGDNMDCGSIYVRFAESDLYIRTPAPCMAVFDQAIGKKPELFNWVIFG